MISAGGIPAFCKSFKFATCLVERKYMGKKLEGGCVG
jgi:hypothetical protein